LKENQIMKSGSLRRLRGDTLKQNGQAINDPPASNLAVAVYRSPN
jgi:hypothetical protein